MFTAEVLLRCIAALLEAQVVILQKASNEQVQGWIDKIDKRLSRFERLLDRIVPDHDAKEPS